MPVERKLFAQSYRGLPDFVCPHCERGRLSRIKESYKEYHPEHLNDYEAQNNGVTYARYAAFATCSDKKCGEIVAECGSYVDIGDWDEDGRYVEFSPNHFYPAPPMFPVPPNVPDKVRGPLYVAFELYWSDVDAAASKVRSSAECLLDALKVPRKKDKKNGQGKVFINFADRIKLVKNPKAREGWLDALRLVGNTGTHGEVKLEHFFDMLDIYEAILRELYDNSADNASKLSAMISRKHRRR